MILLLAEAIVFLLCNALLRRAFPSFLAQLGVYAILGVLAFLFIVSGAERITYARRMRYFGLPNAGMATVTGVLNVACGLVFFLMPAFSGVVIGYVLAAYLIVGGASLLVEAISMRPIER